MTKWTLLAACLIGNFISYAALADWPNYRGPDTDAVVAMKPAPEKLVLKPLWNVPLGDSFGQIAVAGDKAVTFIEKGVDEAALCLDVKTGKELWATTLDKSIKDKMGGNGPRTTPTIEGDKVYLYGTNMKLFCLDLATGKVLWKHDIAKEFTGKMPTWGNAVSPVVLEDLVIIVGGGAEKGILAFNKASGELAWAKTSDKLTHATPTVATILGVKQVICFMQSGLVSVDPKTGEVLWRFAHPYKTSTAASPVVGGKNSDIVYCSAGYQMGAAACRISKQDGKWTATGLWRTEAKNMSHWSTPVYYEGYLYGLFGHNDKKGPLACLDIETGEVKWSQPDMGSQGGLILLGDKLLIQTPTGDLVLTAASPAGYKELGRMNILKGKNWTAPAYSNGLIFARNSSEKGVTAEGVCLKME